MLSSDEISKMSLSEFLKAYNAGKMTIDQFLFYFYLVRN